MKIKKKHIIKYFKLLTDTSALRMAREWPLQGGVKLRPWTAFFDSLWCKIRYGIRTREYFYFALYNKSARARKQFVGEAESAWTLAYIVNRGDKQLFGEKWRTYQAFRPFYRREMVKITLPDDAEGLTNFAQRNGCFILKPIISTQGRGVLFYDNREPKAEEKLKQICTETIGDVIIEEIIKQDKELTAYHPSSINTIRYVVDYCPDGTTDHLFAIIRMGVGNNRIDNTHAGGLCAAIDLKTGIIVSGGVRQNGDTCLVHPDTGKQIIGSQIPRWLELRSFVEQIRPAVGLTDVHLVGWDLALTPDGWCIVEGNAGPSMMGIQGSMGIGYRSLLKRVRNRSKQKSNV